MTRDDDLVIGADVLSVFPGNRSKEGEDDAFLRERLNDLFGEEVVFFPIVR